ncbi:MAG TPA: urease accessory protein [Planktomarina temperata]|nr:urease accessory protein [Planktomarina temperata]
MKHLSLDREGIFQRARGTLNISAVFADGDQSRLKDLRQQGSYRAIFPRPAKDEIEAVIINTAGGITGGDKFSTEVTANSHAKISVTTQAAERIYRASNAIAGSMQTRLKVKSNAQLYWLPQETILFEGSRLCRRLEVEVARDAKFLMVEPLVFGREASGEILQQCSLDDRVCITTEGTPIYVDRVKLDGDIACILKRPAVAAGARAMASIVLVDQMAKAMIDGVRALLPSSGGASLLADNILVIRLLCSDSFALRTALLPILTHLTHNAVPKNWRL